MYILYLFTIRCIPPPEVGNSHRSYVTSMIMTSVIIVSLVIIIISSIIIIILVFVQGANSSCAQGSG